MAENTGTIQDPAFQTIINKDDKRLHVSFVNDSGVTLVEGMEVIFKTNGTIDKRELGTEKPFGIVIKGAANGLRATIRVYATVLMNAVATGGNLPNAGTFVVPNGNIDATYPYPEVIAAVDGDFVTMMIVKGANANLPIKVLVLNSPFAWTAPAP